MDIPSIIIQIFVVLFAITVHEAAHGWAAARMGDFTARSMGRVSLNPLVHIDPIGTILLPLLLIIAHQPAFGWAKPVPVNPYNLRHPRRDHLWISFAGPIANLLTAAVAAVLFLLAKAWISGLTSSSFLARPAIGLANILIQAFSINMILALFNLIPIPPLDGSGILSGLLSDSAAAKYDQLRPYGFVLIILLAYTRVLSVIYWPIRILTSYLIR